MQLTTNQTMLELSNVEQNSAGLPIAWPLLFEGENFLTINGKSATLSLSSSDIDNIVEYHYTKGNQIPIDSRHVISNLAVKIGKDEADILREMPRLAGTAGFGSLVHKGNALFLSDVEWNKIGQEVMSNGLIRYFSPTIQGLDGKSPLRVTSVSLDNEPCLNNLASLAMSEVELNLVATPEELEQLLQTKGGNMPEETTQEVNPLLEQLKEVLGDDVTMDNIVAKIAALKTNSESAKELGEKVKTLEMSEESRKLSEVRQKGLDQGKLTEDMMSKSYFSKMNSVQLSEYCDSVAENCAVPVANLQLSETKPQSYNSVAEALKNAPILN